MLILDIQAFVLHSADRTILVDTCVGEGKERPLLPDFHRRHHSGFLEHLARVGVQPESVDLVFCTHSARRSRRLEYALARRRLGSDLPPTRAI